MQLIFVSSTNAAMCTVTSAFGVVFLAILGALFNAEVPELMDSHIAPADPHAFATVCFAAAGLYLFTFLFCFCQSSLISKKARADAQFSNIQ
ncbi:hypothetical protein BJ742DRAFT_841573 [Cladochytrium replicatum]|nr:hypothetical protein BJ742DRAFT_841573 [Cladochytrium replicatum]